MKKFICLFSILFLFACSSTQEQVNNKNIEFRNTNRVEQNSAVNRYNNCNTCTTSYTVRKPVEVIYENTTYTTVYEPKTYTTVTHERKPYNKCENSDLCY